MNARKTQNVGRTATTGDAQSTNNADCMPTSIDNSYETAVIKKRRCPCAKLWGAQYDAARTNNKQRPNEEEMK